MQIVRKTLAAILILSLVLSFAGCCLKHEWAPADCVKPMTCLKCGKTQGSPLGHKWKDADCTHPKTCSVCSETEGEALGHSFGEWEPVDPDKIGYKDKAVCSLCGEETERDTPRNEPKKRTIINDDGIQISIGEFVNHLIDYLPEGCYITDLEGDTFNIQGKAWLTVTFNRGDKASNGASLDAINFFGTVISGEKDLIYMTPYLSKAIDAYADESAYTKAQSEVRKGFSSGIDGMYGASFDLKTVSGVMLYIPSIGDHPMLSFSSKKAVRSS